VTPEVAVRSRGEGVGRGSDHRPIIADLVLPKVRSVHGLAQPFPTPQPRRGSVPLRPYPRGPPALPARPGLRPLRPVGLPALPEAAVAGVHFRKGGGAAAPSKLSTIRSAWRAPLASAVGRPGIAW
jgi:hypothetical protein